MCVPISDRGTHRQTDGEQDYAVKTVHRGSPLLGHSPLMIEQLPMTAITAIGTATAGVRTCDGMMSRRQRLAVKMTLPMTGSGSPCTLAETLSCHRPAMTRSVLNT
jgi:hypothetical protein